jgi:N-acetylglucosamine kinase
MKADLKLCADIGGSFVTVALVRGEAEIVERHRRPTPVDDWDALTLCLGDAARRHAHLLAPDAPFAVALAGSIDPRTDLAAAANIPCLAGRRVAPELGARLGRKVIATNDADCFALAEARLGAGRGHDKVFGVILGTGVGGGLVYGGRLVTGEGGVAGEWGHGTIVTASRGDPAATPSFPCGCGLSGCLNTVGGARGLERLHRYLHDEDVPSGDITRRWASRDAAAAATLGLYLDLLAGPLAMLANTLGVSVIPLGGGLANAPGLVAALDGAVRARMLRSPAAALLVPAQLGRDAGLLGAGLAAGQRGAS